MQSEVNSLGESSSELLQGMQRSYLHAIYAMNPTHADEAASTQPPIPESVPGPVTLAKGEQYGRMTVVLSLPLPKPGTKRAVKLTPHQRDIVRFVAAGDTNKAIAAKLDLHVRTVDKLVHRLSQKLGVHARAAVVAASLPFLEL